MGELLELRVLTLSDNNLRGRVNSNIFKLPNIQVIALTNNMLQGTIPIEAFYKLKFLEMGNNLFTGSLSAFNDYNTTFNSTLIGIDISKNRFYGELPDFTRFPVLER